MTGATCSDDIMTLANSMLLNNKNQRQDITLFVTIAFFVIQCICRKDGRTSALVILESHETKT